MGRSQGSREPLLDGGLDGVVELHPAAGEELDAVVRHRVVAGGEHHAEVGAERVGQVGDAGRRQHAEQQHVDAGGQQAGDDRGLEELPGDPGVPPDHGKRPVPGEDTGLAEDVRSGDGEVERELGGDHRVREPTDPVRAEEATHQCGRPSDQRLLYCGALRAFFRPAFLRSMTRASRVSSPAFLSDGRLASTSIAFRHAGHAEAQRAGLAGDAAAVDAGDRRRSGPRGRCSRTAR